MQRRELLKLSGAVAIQGLIGNTAFAKAKSLEVLILGGTGFIGPHFVDALIEGGHTVTLFNRGKRNPEANPRVEQLLGDRNGQIEALQGRDWDVVIDNSGYTPKQVGATAGLLRGHVGHYLFISSVSVYADFSKAGLKEDDALAVLKGDDRDTVNNESYGALKALCEQIVRDTYGANATLIRPSYIAGPGDITDRFTYWPFRVSQGGAMLAPGVPSDPFQYIDVRDLAAFVRRCVEERVPGAFNLCTAQGSVTIGSLLETSKRVTRADTRFVWASKEFLEQNEIIGERAKGNYMPIWQSASDAEKGVCLASNVRARKQGLKNRPLTATIKDTLEWQKHRPAEQQKLRAGLTPEAEAQLLAKLKA